MDAFTLGDGIAGMGRIHPNTPVQVLTEEGTVLNIVLIEYDEASGVIYLKCENVA